MTTDFSQVMTENQKQTKLFCCWSVISVSFFPLSSESTLPFLFCLTTTVLTEHIAATFYVLGDTWTHLVP